MSDVKKPGEEVKIENGNSTQSSRANGNLPSNDNPLPKIDLQIVPPKNPSKEPEGAPPPPKSMDSVSRFSIPQNLATIVPIDSRPSRSFVVSLTYFYISHVRFR